MEHAVAKGCRSTPTSTGTPATADRPGSAGVLPLPVCRGCARPARGEDCPAPCVTLDHRLRTVVLALMDDDPEGGCPTVNALAESLRVSSRSLQRILAARQSSFSDILRAARFETAHRLLATTERSVTQIATDLGYSDASHFTRAFRRWSGLAPKQLRHALARNASAGQPRLVDLARSIANPSGEAPARGASMVMPPAVARDEVWARQPGWP